MKNDERFGELDSLSKWQLVHSEQDIRGWPVVSPTGETFGIVDDMLVDKDHEHVAAVRLKEGRNVAVDKLELTDDQKAIYHEAGAASRIDYRKVRRQS